MEYLPIDNIPIKNEYTWHMSKRNIGQTISRENESFTLSNKRTCDIEEMKLYRKDSIQSLKIHIDPDWNLMHNDFEHAISTHRTKPIPIIFHLASEEIMDVQNYGSDNVMEALNSINSTVSLPTISVHDSHDILTRKSSQSEINSLSLVNTTDILKSSLSISNTSLDRSLERLQANYREHLARREEDMKTSIYQQAYIRCRKHRQFIPVQIIASDSERKICQFVEPNSSL